jgi:soluble lytic murein transglycosylase
MPALPAFMPTPSPTLSLDLPTASPVDGQPTLPTSSPTASPPPAFADDPVVPAGNLEQADQAMAIGDWPAAMEKYQAALDAARDPESQTAALAGVGRTYYRSGDLYNALQVLRSLVEAYPTSDYAAEAFFITAQIHASQNRPAEAAQAYLEFLDQRPDVIDAYIHEWRGDTLWSAGDYAGALAAFQAALNSPRLPSNLDLEIKLAQMYALTGDSATALVMYADIYQRSSMEYQKARVDLLQGRLHASLNQTEQASTAWLDAVNHYPQLSDAYQSLVELVNAGYPVDELLRGKVDYYAGEYNVALAALDRYLATVSDDPVGLGTAYHFRGLVLRAMGDVENALAMWDFAIQNYPDLPMIDQVWEEKGYTQWAYLEQHPDAIQTLLDFAAAYPVHARAAEFIFDAARVAERSGDLALASQLWQRMVAEYPTNPLAYEATFQAGIVDFRRADYTVAQARFVSAQQMAAAPEDLARAYLWIGKSYQAQGDDAAANSFWSLGADTDPTGYYSERAGDLAAGIDPFTPPQVFDFGFDANAERRQAEAWLRQTFTLPEGTDLDSDGDVLNEPSLQRGMELWRLGMYELAGSELDDLRLSYQNDPANTYRLMNYLLEQGIYRLAILSSRQILTAAGMDDATTLDAPMYFNRIRFGNYYASLVIPAAKDFGLHPLLVWSVIRQESLFDATIRSSAGATGLMQITPPTGQDIADRLGWPPNFTEDDLLRPQVSLRLGLDYLVDQIAYLDNNLYAALAGYNAGPGNAAAWKALAPNDPDLLLEVIRFSEPQRYIRGIYEIFSIYRLLYERTP